MATIRDDAEGPCLPDDVLKFVESRSDMGFELRCLHELRSLGMKCCHAGSYIDPITQKLRQYDIRAACHFPERKTCIALAVECKCIPEDSPVVVSCVRRRGFESIHNIVYVPPSPRGLHRPTGTNWGIRPQEKECSGYRMDYWVGKSVVQISRPKKNQKKAIEFEEVKNSGFYDKWSQAVSSLPDLIKDLLEKGADSYGECNYTFLPVMVIPDDCLWRVCYDEDGQIGCQIRQVPHVSYYVDREVEAVFLDQSKGLRISHVEFMTPKGLVSFCENIKRRQGFSSLWDL